jgi:hypothetical protein
MSMLLIPSLLLFTLPLRVVAHGVRLSNTPITTLAGVSEIDDSQFLATEHYRDFLNREPDAAGLQFWTSNIESCGANAQCREVKRVNVSAAFFLSIEFQQPGYLVYRMYKAAFGNLPNKPVPLTRASFLPDTQAIGNGVVVNQGDWRTQLENNKNAFALSFVQRAAFLSAYPSSMSATDFVNKLDQNAGLSCLPRTRPRLSRHSAPRPAMRRNALPCCVPWLRTRFSSSVSSTAPSC